MASSDRLQLVSGLYGPGAVGCWLCIVASVFVSWTLNKKTRKKDTITNDFIAVLTLPTVAAGHLIYQIISYTGDRSTILTTQDPELLPRVAAMEASLNICETFAALALTLFAIAAFKFHIGRCITVATVGLVCFGTESALFFISPDSSVKRSNFTRPFILNEQRAMIPTFIVITAVCPAAVIVWFRVASRTRTRSRSRDTAETGNGGIRRVLQRGRYHIDGVHHQVLDRMRLKLSDQGALELPDRMRLQMREVAVARDDDVRAMRSIAIVSLLFLPLTSCAAAVSASFPLGAWGVTPLGALHSFAWRLRFFIPETSSKITELDQAVALAGGAATLGFSLLEAVKSSVDSDEQTDAR